MTQRKPLLSPPSLSFDRSAGQTTTVPLLRSLRNVEWLAAIVITAVDLWHRYLAQRAMGAQIWGSAVPFLLLLGLLAWLQSRELWKRRAPEILFWLIFQIVVVTLTSIAGTCGPLYFFSVLITAKAVLLLGLRSAAVVVIVNLTVLGLLMTAGTRIFERHGAEYAACAAEIGLQVSLAAIINLIVVFFARTIMREIETRRRVEQLAHENEELTAELERGRIARDLHDTLGHSLVSLGLQLEMIEEFRGLDEQRTEKALRTARQLTNELITEVRRAVHVIHDPAFNLDSSLKELVEQVHLNDKLSVNLRLAQEAIPTRISRELYCIAKECLTNVQKHACATHVTLQIDHTSTHVQLSIVDDGKGFYPSPQANGFGLKNIEERVRIMAGKLSLNSAPDKGTSITVSIPV